MGIGQVVRQWVSSISWGRPKNPGQTAKSDSVLPRHDSASAYRVAKDPKLVWVQVENEHGRLDPWQHLVPAEAAHVLLAATTKARDLVRNDRDFPVTSDCLWTLRWAHRAMSRVEHAAGSWCIADSSVAGITRIAGEQDVQLVAERAGTGECIAAHILPTGVWKVNSPELHGAAFYVGIGYESTNPYQMQVVGTVAETWDAVQQTYE